MGPLDIEAAARALNVGARSVKRARVVLNSGKPELVHAVESGELAVRPAAELVSKSTPPTPPHTSKPTGRRIDHEKRQSDVLALHKEGRGTEEIAETLGLHPSTVSDVKVTLGIASSTPAVKLWKDVDHVATTLSGATSQIEKLAALVVGAPLSATEEEIESCIKRLSAVTASIRHLSAGLRTHRRQS